MLNSSKLTHKITIQKQFSEDGEYGTEHRWVNVAERIHAEVFDVLPSRDESVKNGIAIGTIKTRIRLRYRTGIDSSMRVFIHGANRTLQIIGGPSVIGNRESIEIFCQEVTTDVNHQI